MKRYLLDTTVLGGYLLRRTVAVEIVEPWISRAEVATSILVYAEVVEYLRSLPDFPRRNDELRRLLKEVHAYTLTYSILERYSDLRRLLRPRGGLIGDIDTLIAATALDRNLIIVTSDSDYQRVPDLRVMKVDLKVKK